MSATAYAGITKINYVVTKLCPADLAPPAGSSKCARLSNFYTLGVGVFPAGVRAATSSLSRPASINPLWSET
jgi:hypothetical protein